jgi:hypothetical protein
MPAHEPTPDSKRERSPAVIGAAIVVPVAAVLYVLAYGPLLLLVKHGALSDSAFLWFFAPIEFLSDRSQAIDSFFFWYARLWGAL